MHIIIRLSFLVAAACATNAVDRRRFMADLHEYEQMPIENPSEKINAAVVVLARDSDLEQLLGTLANFEAKFNKQYHYPYVFLNDIPFREYFKSSVLHVTSSACVFGEVPPEHWDVPGWLNMSVVKESMTHMKKHKVRRSTRLGYRQMCRFFSGFFFRHPLLRDYDYYWRVEPGARFLCDIPFDPFARMQHGGFKYSFTITQEEQPLTVPTLFNISEQFREEHHLPGEHISKLLSPSRKEEWSGCHYWSNFEIGDLAFFRSERYIAYFENLDRAGGFFYERWGDAPVRAWCLSGTT
jgi:hypothetical protein